MFHWNPILFLDYIHFLIFLKHVYIFSDYVSLSHRFYNISVYLMILTYNLFVLWVVIFSEFFFFDNLSGQKKIPPERFRVRF